MNVLFANSFLPFRSCRVRPATPRFSVLPQSRRKALKMPNSNNPPQFELICGPVHLVIERVPTWLVTLVTTTATGAGAAWWASR